MVPNVQRTSSRSRVRKKKEESGRGKIDVTGEPLPAVNCSAESGAIRPRKELGMRMRYGALACAAWVLGGCAPQSKPAPAASKPETPKTAKVPEAAKMTEPQEVVTPTGLRYIDLTPGSGPSPKKGDQIQVHY